MARPILSNKRDTEKKKNEKRAEKQKRKDDRKQSGSSSFDDMIAYVDASGRILSTPPDEQDSANDIVPQIQTPKQEAQELKGRVEHMNDEKGYGFIKESGSTNKYFFHISNLQQPVKVGDSVSFFTERGKRGMSAVMIRINN